jgi:hypothetical protein
MARVTPMESPPYPEAWDGPIYGDLGVLAAEPDGKRVQCHACGDWFSLLASHVRQAHGITPASYRALFGLKTQTALAAPQLRERRRELSDGPLRPYRERAGEMGRSHTPEERRARMLGRRLRLEAQLDPARAEAARAGQRNSWQTRYARHGPTGHRRPLTFPNAREASLLAQEKRRQRFEDPEYLARLSARCSEAKGGRVEARCIICGAPFMVPPSWLALGYGKLCGAACRDRWKLRRRRAPDGRPFEEVVALLKASGEQTEHALDRLPDPMGRAARLYFGLTDGRPWTTAEIATHLDTPAARVKSMLRSATLRRALSGL